MGDAFFSRDTRWAYVLLALDIYPQLLVRTLDFSAAARVPNPLTTPYAMERSGTGEAAAAEGLVLAMVRTNEEFRREPQYTDVLSKNAADHSGKDWRERSRSAQGER